MRELSRGGGVWFAIQTKSFEIAVEQNGKKLKDFVWEHRRGVSSWIRFGDLS